MRHTPGPWIIGNIKKRNLSGMIFSEIPIHAGSNDPGVGYGNCFILVALGGKGAISAKEEDVLANARLIAAAPDLLEALKQIINDLPSRRDWLSPDIERFAKAAIAAAEGE